MTPEQEQLLESLSKQVQELSTWKQARDSQQIRYPLDQASKDVLAKEFLRVTGRLVFTRASGEAGSYYFIVNLNGKDELVATTPPIRKYFVDVSDLFTSQNHGFVDDDELQVLTTDTLPAPLAEATKYFVINATANTFKLSATSMGAAINITSVGVGTQYITYF